MVLIPIKSTIAVILSTFWGAVHRFEIFSIFPIFRGENRFFGHNISTDWDIDLKKVSVPTKSTITDISSYVYVESTHILTKVLKSVLHCRPLFKFLVKIWVDCRLGQMPIFGTFSTFPAEGKLLVVFSIVEMYYSRRKIFWRNFATWDYRFDCTSSNKERRRSIMTI